MSDGPIIPTWIGVSAAIVMMLVVAAHAVSMAWQDMPASRRRIRNANACVMLLAIPLLAAGFSIIDADTRPREWMLTWIAAIGLIGFSVFLAMLDVINTLRLRRRLLARRGARIRRLRERSALRTAESTGRRGGPGGGSGASGGTGGAGGSGGGHD